MILAGAKGIEPLIEVLETSVIPFNYAPRVYLLYYNRPMISNSIKRIIKISLEEDIGSGDWTTIWLIPEKQTSQARIVAKDKGIIAGLEVAKEIFGPSVKFTELVKDGAKVQKNQTVAVVEGPTRLILSCERTVLNFMQRMSGIASQTYEFVKLTQATKAVILDTRKTMPGLRELDKWAVRLGGAQNHRFGLYDMILVKDNHIQAVGGISKAMQVLTQNNNNKLEVEIEVDNLEQLKEAINAGAKKILLDNFSLENIKKAVNLNNSRAVLEVSGGVTLENVANIAKTGVDYISVGSLTHSVKAMDLSIEIN